MRKKWHSSHTGADAEKTFSDALERDGYRFAKEKVAHSTRTAATSKGKFDFRISLADKDHCIEVKSRSGDITIPTRTATNPNIKTHQIKALREERIKGSKVGFLLNFRKDTKWIYLSLEAFDKMVLENIGLKAIKCNTALKYGCEIDFGSLDFLC